MASPAIMPLPGSFFWRARSTVSPNPPAATMLAMVTMASAIIVVWLTPAMMVGSAMGIWTLVKVCKGDEPKACVASMAAGDTCCMPEAGQADHRRY